MRASSVERAILDSLNCENCHMTAREILHSLRPRLPAVNPSTIYRALDRLAASGEISVSDIGLGSSVYEIINNHTHHHMVCQSCGQIEMLEKESVDQFINQVTQSSRYAITTNHLVLFGLCPSCQQEKNNQQTTITE